MSVANNDPPASAGDTDRPGSAALVPAALLAPFALVTTLFVLWGFANDITNPMVAAFKNVLLLSNFESSLVQAAFYGGYCFMAIPAALLIRRAGYRSGILLGLALYAVGCLLFVPAGQAFRFDAFLVAYFTMTCGLAFLETTANPYILAMGDPETAARRLNLAQAFNPLGSLLGMLTARNLILARLDPLAESERRALAETDAGALQAIQQSDLGVIVGPYVVLGVVVLLILALMSIARLPACESDNGPTDSAAASFRRLLANRRYTGGVIAQAFYVGAQIMCWTFIIQYAVNELGMAATEAQSYNIAAMVIFVVSRFLCTYLLKFVNAGALLAVLAVVGAVLIIGVVTVRGPAGLYCLVAVSACMSLMFPTIYGLALADLGDDAKLGSAGLICAIGGGCFMPPLQAAVMDGQGLELGMLAISATRVSFVLPLVCFLVIAAYGAAMIKSRPAANAAN